MVNIRRICKSPFTISHNLNNNLLCTATATIQAPPVTAAIAPVSVITSAKTPVTDGEMIAKPINEISSTTCEPVSSSGEAEVMTVDVQPDTVLLPAELGQHPPDPESL